MSLISSISSITGQDKQRKGAFLAEVDDNGDQISGSVRQFQYYPETISDHRGVSYITKEVIGGSHPIYQWVHGSERVISFEAVFTADFYVDDNPLQTLSNFASAIKNPVAAIGSALLGGKDLNSIPISQYIAWLRSKTYPKYDGSNPVSPPPRLLLWLENSGINSNTGSSSGGTAYTTDVIPVIMRQCNVEYHAFFRNGMPRIATVSLEFAETIQIGDSWQFVNRSDVEVLWTSGALPNGGNSQIPAGGNPGGLSSIGSISLGGF